MVKSKKMKFENSKLNLNQTLELFQQSKKAFLIRNVISCFLKMARLLLVLIVKGSECHKIGAA